MEIYYRMNKLTVMVVIAPVSKAAHLRTIAATRGVL